MKKILVCTNYRVNPNMPSCRARGSQLILTQLLLQLEEEKLDITVEEVQCLGYCDLGPNVRLAPNGRFFHHVAIELKEIITETQLFLAP